MCPMVIVANIATVLMAANLASLLYADYTHPIQITDELFNVINRSEPFVKSCCAKYTTAQWSCKDNLPCCKAYYFGLHMASLSDELSDKQKWGICFRGF